MRKVVFIVFSFIAVFVCTAQTSTGDSLLITQKIPEAERTIKTSLPADTNLVTNDLKKGFKDLFIPNNEVAGMNTAQLNPRAISFVEDYMQKHTKNLEKLKGWGRPYFDMMDVIFALHRLPKELKYLAVIESHLKTYAVSWAGAVGPWQFMPATGRRMGLKVTNYMDERTDYYKSTHAAARYLTELYSIFNDCFRPPPDHAKPWI